MITDDYISTIIEGYTLLIGEIPKVYVSNEVYSNLKCKMNVEVERYLANNTMLLLSENYGGFVANDTLYHFKAFNWEFTDKDDGGYFF